MNISEYLRNVKYHLSLMEKKGFYYLKEQKRKYTGSSGRVSSKPTTIQLPITYLCNFDCVMCGMHHLINNTDFSAEELKKIISDPLFSEITVVGINGGEPFLKKDLVDCVSAMVETLPKLKEFYIISNGFFPELIDSKLTEIRKKCGNRIKIHLSLSVDGIKDMQDFHRGHAHSFEKIEEAISILRKKDYLDSLGIICTITRFNIARISEVEIWAKENNLDISYNIATENVRIENQDKVQAFSLLYDEESRMLAQEFFFHLFLETHIEKYYALYLFLKDQYRYSKCPYQTLDWITLTPNCQIGFCATHSKNIGNALDNSAAVLVQNNLPYLKELCASKCNTCSHYIQNLDLKGLHDMHKTLLKERFMRGGNKW